MLERITQQARNVVTELLEQANMRADSQLVIGCSSSEIPGKMIGTGTSMEAARAVFAGVSYPSGTRNPSVQSCAHLNPALIPAREALLLTAWNKFRAPLQLTLWAEAGIDIGGTLIGMHLKAVSAPVRITVKQIGEAKVLCARTRPRFIGGPRAIYQI